MSRDHHVTYNLKLACLKCRKSWRKDDYLVARRTRLFQSCDELMVCPQCQGQLVSMGVDFKAPARSNIRQWRKVELLVEAGVRFEVRRFTRSERDMVGPGARPYSLREMKLFLEERAQENRRIVQQRRKMEKAAQRRQRIAERKLRSVS